MKQVKCLACDTELILKPSQRFGKYCSNKCQQDFQRQKTINDWKEDPSTGVKSGLRLKAAVRDFLLSKSNYACSRCGWDKVNPSTGNSPLEIDHIDGDCTNNSENNLRVLCPNCHSLTDTWKALNKGKGNRERLSYFSLTQ